jgi:membrane-associated HD superfamily phosphohydrolase
MNSRPLAGSFVFKIGNMFLFNVILLIHFIAFLLYLLTLVTEMARPVLKRDKKGLALGIIILLTGLTLVALKYPNVNYYKVVPKLSIFLVIAVMSAVHGEKPMTRSTQYLLLTLSFLASAIGVVKV